MENFENMIGHTILIRYNKCISEMWLVLTQKQLIHASRPSLEFDPDSLWVENLKGGIEGFPNITEAYKWHKIKKMDFDTAIKNADSYGMYTPCISITIITQVKKQILTCADHRHKLLRVEVEPKMALESGET